MDINEAIFNTVRTVRLFEKGFTSCKRTPVDYQVRPESLSEFIEFRINFEFFKIKEFELLEQLMDGYLFVVSDLTNENGNSYDRVTVSLNKNKPDFINSDDYNDVINKATSMIGGDSISFTSDKKNLGIIIR